MLRGREATSRRTLRARLEQNKLIRVTRGIYADWPPADDDLLRAIFLRLPAEALLGRQSAAQRLGFDGLHDRSIHIVLPPGVVRPRIPGVVVHEEVVPIGEPVVVDGIPCVPPVRCAVDLARTVRRLDALPVLDSVLRGGLCTVDDLLAEVDRHHGLRGVRQARELIPMADGRSECRQESQVRLILIDGKLPSPEPQIWVLDADGVPLYRIDLGYRERRVGIEYDGVTHLDRDRLRHDRARSNWLHAHGWTMRHFTDRDLYRRPGHLVDVVRAALL